MKVRVCRKFVTIQTLEVEAESREEAINKVQRGDCHWDDDDLWESTPRLYLESEGDTSD